MLFKNQYKISLKIEKLFFLIILSIFFFSGTTLAISIFGFNLFEKEELNESKSIVTIQEFKGLSVKDMEEKEIVLKEKKEGIGQTIQNTKLALSTEFDVVDEIIKESNDGGRGTLENELTFYEVKSGDTLASIASYLEVSKDSLITLNQDLLEDGKVSVGDVLKVYMNTPGIGYKIKKGDNLSKIAKKYNIDSEDISLFNGIIDNDNLAVGDIIFLPNAKMIKEESEKKVKDKSKDINDSLAKNKDNKINTLADKISKTTMSDVAAILKLKKYGGRYSNLQKIEGYFINPAPTAVRTQKIHGHNGVDLAARIGTPILASADGIVAVARTTGWNYGYGKYIVINHPNGTQTVYAHLNSINVVVGQSVTKGQKIAEMGNTGRSTGPHVHFEIRGAYNPFAW